MNCQFPSLLGPVNPNWKTFQLNYPLQISFYSTFDANYRFRVSEPSFAEKLNIRAVPKIVFVLFIVSHVMPCVMKDYSSNHVTLIHKEQHCVFLVDASGN